MIESTAKPATLVGRDRLGDYIVLGVSCLVLLLALVLVERRDGRVAPRGFSQLILPEACISKVWLGWRCPACGLTRSIIHLAQGDWRASWRNHRLGLLTALLIVLQVPDRVMRLSRPAHRSLAARWRVVLGYALIILFLVNWVVEVVSCRVFAH